MQSLELTERELLEAVAQDRGDQAALSVLADYWIQHGDVARGTFVQLHCGELDGRLELAAEEARLGEHAAAWRAPLVRAGFAEADLAFDRGLLQWPLALDVEPDDHPELFRISPLVYRLRRGLQHNSDFQVFAADVVTPMGATHARRDRVAIKCPTRFAEDAMPWIEREHAILRRLSHPNVVSTLGYAATPTGLGLVTRWAGTGLDRVLAATRRHQVTLGVELAVSVAVQLCDALDALHRAGVVHCDLRPDHVLVAEDGTVTVIDFGYARAAEPRPAPRYYSPGPRGRPLFGYLSPEQTTGVDLDPRSDLFSAAVIACELVDGVHLIRERRSDFDVVLAVRDLRHVLPPLPLPLAGVLRRTIAPLDQRIATAAELRDALVDAAASARLAIGPHVIAQRLCELGVAT